MAQESLKDKVYGSLRLDILTRKIPGGTRITESAIASDLQVSRTPVREALLKLCQDKLITAIPRAGYIVEDLSDSDIQDLFSTRMEIEKIAVRLAVQYISVDELKMLDDNLEGTRAAIKSEDTEKMADLDMAFHEMVHKAARSKTLFRICRNLSEVSMKYRHGLYLVKELWNDALQHHIAIYQALIARDPDQAMAAVEVHARQAGIHLSDTMKRVRSDTFSMDSL